MKTAAATYAALGLFAFFLGTSPAHSSGACCRQAGNCYTASQTVCAQELGVYQGENTVCSPSPCPPAPLNDVCSTAISIPRCLSGVGYGTTLGAQRDYDPGTPGPSCIGVNAWGPDVAYRLDLLAGDVADLTFTAHSADGAMYLVTDCAQVSATCVAGADNTLYGQPESIHYVAPHDGTYFLILDGDYQYLAGTYDLAYGVTCANAGVPQPFDRETSRLLPATPNPFAASTELHYAQARAGRIEVEIFDAGGRSIRRLMDAEAPAGQTSLRWDGRDSNGRPVTAGAYFCRVISGAVIRSQVVVKSH